MNRYNKLAALVLNLLLFVPGFAFAQESTIKKFEVNGVKVIFKPSVKEIISVRLFVDGGTSNYPKEMEGLENLALKTAVQGGTISLSKVAFNTEAEKIGTILQSSSSYDYGEISMNCIKPYWDKSWELFVDVVLQPAFNEKEFNLIKEQLISNAKQTQSNPDAYLNILSMSNAFKDRNYSKIPQGTPESLSRLTLEDAKNYYKNMLGKKSCFLVIVGNITEADLKAKINSSLAKLPEGKTAVKEKRVAITNPQIVIENRDIATNYLNGVLLAPLATDRESVAMKVAMEILNDRFFIELRTNRSLSYAPKAYHRGNMVTDPFNVLYITTLDPKTSMKVMVDEVDKVRKSGFSEKELKDMKQTFLTYYFLNLETNDAQTLALGTLELAGDYKLFEKLTSEVNQLTLTELNKAFRKYSDKISWTYLGKKDAVKMDDFPQPGILGDNSLEVKK